MNDNRVRIAGSLLAVPAVLLALAGCQRTLFESAPAVAHGCETLVGHWTSLGDERGRDGEMEATIAADCSVRLVEHGREGPRSFLPLRLHVATQPARWLWVDAAEANAALAVQPGPLDSKGTVYAFAWSLDGGLLTLVPPAHRPLAHRIVDGTVDGAVHAEDHFLTVRIEGTREEIAALMAGDGGLDQGEAMRFRRRPAETP